jgi:hypothetical protein
MTPRKALRDAGGQLSMRAVRHCDAVTSACAFGWWLYPPMDAWLRWDGATIFYSLDGENFDPLEDTCVFPGMSDALSMHMPSGMQPLSAPLFTALPEPGIVQMSLGLIARTAPGWSLLLRPPANLSLFGGYNLLEGIVETDLWRGPLFTNLRLTRTHSKIHLSARAPIVQAQPVPQWLYHASTMGDMQHGTLADMTEDDWSAWNETFIEPVGRPDRLDGEYAVRVRTRRRGACPVAHGAPVSTGDTVLHRSAE